MPFHAQDKPHCFLLFMSDDSTLNENFLHYNAAGSSGGDWYLYLETSYGEPGDSSAFTLDVPENSVELRFHFAMVGADIGKLQVGYLDLL